MNGIVFVAFWAVLGIESTTDLAAIKCAYAAKLKTLDRERDVEAFQALREAYESAMAWARSGGHGDLIAADGVETDAGELPSWASAMEAREVVAEVRPSAPPASDAAVSMRSGTDIARAVDEILDACARLEHSDALMAFLDALPALQRLENVDRVGRALATVVQDHEDMRWPMLAALVERFDWAAVSARPGMTSEDGAALQAFIRRRNLRELIAHHALPRDLQMHYDDLARHLKPPFGFWRALRIASLLLRDLRQSIAVVRAGFGADSTLVVSREAEDFVDAVYGRDAPWSIALASVIGRAYGLSVALILLFGAIAVVGKGWTWAFAHVLPLWLSVFVGCAIGVALVRGARRLFASRA